MTDCGYAEIDNDIAPTLGRTPLDELSPTQIDAKVNALRGPLSDTTRRPMRKVEMRKERAP